MYARRLLFSYDLENTLSASHRQPQFRKKKRQPRRPATGSYSEAVKNHSIYASVLNTGHHHMFHDFPLSMFLFLVSVRRISRIDGRCSKCNKTSNTNRERLALDRFSSPSPRTEKLESSKFFRLSFLQARPYIEVKRPHLKETYSL
jgi:hypothetical protein